MTLHLGEATKRGLKIFLNLGMNIQIWILINLKGIINF